MYVCVCTHVRGRRNHADKPDESTPGRRGGKSARGWGAPPSSRSETSRAVMGAGLTSLLIQIAPAYTR